MTGLPLAAILVATLASAAPAGAAMCHTSGAATARLAALTARASASFLEASSQALLALKALDESSGTFSDHRARAVALLDAATVEYREALALADDLPRGDEFLRVRPFERLRANFGISPGTLNATRWETLARIARESHKPTADLIAVCVAGAQSLRVTMLDLEARTPPSMARRAAYAWFLVITHGGLVSDAFDTSIR